MPQEVPSRADYTPELRRLLARSAQRYARSAEEFRRGSGEATTLDVRHLMAVFIYKPWIHERDLAGWGFEQEARVPLISWS